MNQRIKKIFYLFACLFAISLVCAKPIKTQAASYKIAKIDYEGKSKTKVNGLTIYKKMIAASSGELGEDDYIPEKYGLFVEKDGIKYQIYAEKNNEEISSSILTNGNNIYFIINPAEYGVGIQSRLYSYILGNTANVVSKLKDYRSVIQGYYNGRVYIISQDDTCYKNKLYYVTLKTKTLTGTTGMGTYDISGDGRYYWIRQTWTGQVSLYDAKIKKKKTLVSYGALKMIKSGSKWYYIQVQKKDIKKVDGWDGSGRTLDLINGTIKINVCRMSLTGGSKKTLIKNLSVRGVRSFTTKSITYRNTKKKWVKKKF